MPGSAETPSVAGLTLKDGPAVQASSGSQAGSAHRSAPVADPSRPRAHKGHRAADKSESERSWVLMSRGARLMCCALLWLSLSDVPHQISSTAFARGAPCARNQAHGEAAGPSGVNAIVQSCEQNGCLPTWHLLSRSASRCCIAHSSPWCRSLGNGSAGHGRLRAALRPVQLGSAVCSRCSPTPRALQCGCGGRIRPWLWCAGFVF